MLLKKEYIIIALLSIGIVFIAFQYYNRPIKIETRQIIKSDTIIKDSIIKGKTIRIKGDAIIEYKPFFVNDTIIDTVFETKPFTATLDTIIKDTFHIAYEFPENKIELKIKEKPDTLKMVEIKTEFERQKTFYENYIEKPLYFAGGILTSFIIYWSTK